MTNWQLYVGKGWRPLVEALVHLCHQNDVYIAQVKEKYGGLRFYVGGAPAWVHTLISAAETASLTICEECGKQGQPRDIGWIKTLCDACHVARSKR